MERALSSGRTKLWAILFTSSIVSLISLLSVIAPEHSRDSYEKWMLSIMSISILFSFFGIMLSTMPPEDAAKMELPCIAIVFGFWCAGMPGILSEDRKLATTQSGIENANLYFFGWTSMITTILLIGSYVKQMNGDVGSTTGLAWTLLATGSLVVMSSVANEFDEYCPEDGESDDIMVRNDEECARAKFAVWLGCISAIISIFCVVAKKLPIEAQAFVALLLLVSWACGVAFLTFGEGPGTEIGDVYFATWANLFLAVNILSTAIHQTLHPPPPSPENDSEQSDNELDEKEKEDEEQPKQEQPIEPIEKEAEEDVDQATA